MSDLNRGIMKFDGADKPVLVAVSAVLVFGGIAALILWALKSAYIVQPQAPSAGILTESY